MTELLFAVLGAVVGVVVGYSVGSRSLQPLLMKATGRGSTLLTNPGPQKAYVYKCVERSATNPELDLPDPRAVVRINFYDDADGEGRQLPFTLSPGQSVVVQVPVNATAEVHYRQTGVLRSFPRSSVYLDGGV